MKKLFFFFGLVATVAVLGQLAVPNSSPFNGNAGQSPTINTNGSTVIWQYPWQKTTNSVPLGNATVILDALKDCVVINTNASFQVAGVANMPVAGTSVKDLLVLVTNNSGANINVTFTAAWHIDKAQGLNQTGIWTITNTCYFLAHWNANNGLYSNFNFNAAQ